MLPTFSGHPVRPGPSSSLLAFPRVAGATDFADEDWDDQLMTNPSTFIPADLARAARAITQVSSKVIGRAAGLEKQQIRAFEKGNQDLTLEQNAMLRHALEQYGAVFVEEDEDAGRGVRRKYNASKVRRLETWEGEGGPAYEDDI